MTNPLDIKMPETKEIRAKLFDPNRGVWEILELLRIRIDDSFVHHVFFMKHFSENKENCPYYKLGLKKFEEFDIAELRAILKEAHEKLEVYAVQVEKDKKNQELEREM